MEITINKGEIVCFDGDTRGLDVTCFCGTIWITQVGDQNDYVLKSDENFRVSRKGLVAITACQTAKAYFSTPVVLASIETPRRIQLQVA